MWLTHKLIKSNQLKMYITVCIEIVGIEINTSNNINTKLNLVII